MLVILNAYSVDPRKQLGDLETEWMLSDQGQVEKRAEKLRVQVKKPTPKEEKEKDTLELAAVEKALAALQKETPLRQVSFEEKERAAIKHFGLFTLKPMLLVENISESAIGKYKQAIEGSFVVAGKLEGELACMDPEERATFLAEYGIAEPARERLIHAAYKLLGLHAFFTSGEDEVRAWTIPVGTKAPLAAGAIHSDIERGFIRAEVVAYDDFVRLGSEAKCREAGKLRLEGKDYVVRDGDVIHFRFNV